MRGSHDAVTRLFHVPRALIRAFLLVAAMAFVGASPAASGPSQAELDSLLAPVALYPDELLAQVLAAATYPLDVVQLDRWLKANAALAPDARDAALQAQPWDDSVKALAATPDVVAMMDGELEWTQRLGDAFLADPAGVMDAVQRLRRHARDAGSLQDNARERVADDGTVIVIEPPTPDVVYVPAYDPRFVYGPWWWPDDPPYFWGGLYFGGPYDFVVGGVWYGGAIYWHEHWHEGAHIDWHGRHVEDHRPGRPPTWQHDPGHRGGVPYTNPIARDRFRPVDPDRVRNRGDFRGFGPRPPAPTAQPPRTANPAARGSGPSPFTPDAHSRDSSQRGAQSLGHAAPSAPSPKPSRGTK